MHGKAEEGRYCMLERKKENGMKVYYVHIDEKKISSETYIFLYTFLYSMCPFFLFLSSHFSVNCRADICRGLHFHLIESRPFSLRGRIWLS